MGIGVLQLWRQGTPSETLPDTFGPCRSCDTEEEASDEGECVELSGNANSMVQVTKMMTSWEWDVSPQRKASGSATQLWWTLAQQKTSYLQASAIVSNSVQLSGLMRALDFVEPAERESAITVRGSSRFE